MGITDTIRSECARVAASACSVQINHARISSYATELAPHLPALDGAMVRPERREHVAAYWLTLNAVNFGSGWFPTLRKLSGMTGYRTIAGGLSRRFETSGPWSPGELARIGSDEVAETFGQDPAHELMALFTASLRDLGARLTEASEDAFSALADTAEGSAIALVETLASWECFADTSVYRGRAVPFLKRAQIAAADLHRGGVVRFDDLAGLTLFADNLVPHVLRLDGIIDLEPGLVSRIERGDLIDHGSPEEVELRACALHAVELLVAASPTGTTAMQLDECLWNRGQQPSYKAIPRHRSRCTAY